MACWDRFHRVPYVFDYCTPRSSLWQNIGKLYSSYSSILFHCVEALFAFGAFRWTCNLKIQITPDSTVTRSSNIHKLSILIKQIINLNRYDARNTPVILIWNKNYSSFFIFYSFILHSLSKYIIIQSFNETRSANIFLTMVFWLLSLIFLFLFTTSQNLCRLCNWLKPF